MTNFRAYSGKPPSRFVDGAALAAVVVLALCVRFYGITTPAIWYDEAFSILLARHEPWQIWSITARDIHPPLYYLALHYWMILFGDGVLAVRSLSVIADVGSVLLSIKLMSLVATRRATWMAALLLVLLPISIRYSQEARMYTLLGFWLMGATVALVCWVKEPEKKRFPAIYVLLMTAAFYTHYFAALGVLVHGCYWLSRLKAGPNVLSARLWILVCCAILVLFLPWLPHFIDHLSGRPGLGWIPAITWQAVVNVVWQFTVMTIWEGQSSLTRVLPWLVVIACAALLVWKDTGLHRFSVLLTGYFFIPVLALAFMSLIAPLFIPRYLVFAAVGLPLLLSAALDAVGLRPTTLCLAIMIMAAAEVQGLLTVYRQADGLNGTELRTDFRLDGLAAEVRQAARPGDQIVLDNAIWYLPFAYYNHTGIQPKFYISSFKANDLDALEQGGNALISEGSQWIYFNQLKVLTQGGNRVWWVGMSVDASPLPEKDWEKTVTFVDGRMNASLFTLKAAPAQVETSSAGH